MTVKPFPNVHENDLHKESSIITMLTGIITLIVVMGMGRFSLTPQIPLMISDGNLTLSSAGILASMNYIGYLLGAIHVSRIKMYHATYLKIGLLATSLATLFSAFSDVFLLQCFFRFIAGIGGAWALIIVTSWTQMILANNCAPRMSAAVFTGPGIGITVTGFLAWMITKHHLHASQAWLVYGCVAFIGTLFVWRPLPQSLPMRQEKRQSSAMSRNLKWLLLAYTLAGFGYILPATFLSQMAHHIFAQGELAAFFWPLFGLSAVIGVLLVITFATYFNTRNSLALTMILQGLGVAMIVIIPNAIGLFIATIITGLAFLSIMQLSMKLAREVTTNTIAKTVAILTSGYASGQLIGPLVSSLSVSLMGSLQPALLLAALTLVCGGLVIITCIKSYTME